MPDDLVVLYEKMYQHTVGECGKCRAPRSCCSPEYCEMAEEMAAEQGVVLERTNHPTLPFMGEGGCVVPPHLRPLCTLHVCSINGLGFKPGDPEWTSEYFRIRGLIELKELQKYDKKRT